jgi:flagellar biosynthetic protein FliQ
MSGTDLSRIAVEALWLVLWLSLPVLLTSLVVGLLVAVLQAVTQVQEQTLSFVPKLAAVTLVLALTGSAMGAEIARFTERLFLSIPTLVG